MDPQRLSAEDVIKYARQFLEYHGHEIPPSSGLVKFASDWDYDPNRCLLIHGLCFVDDDLFTLKLVQIS